MPSDISDSAQDSIPPATNTNVSIKSRLSSLTIVTFFVAVLLAFAGGLFFSKQAAQFLPSFIPQSVDIPLKVNSPSIYRASFVYAFNTKVVDLEEKDGKTILKTEVKGIDNLPEFIIDNDTVVAVVQNDIETKVKDTSILTPGTPIYAYLSYNLIQKKWLTTRIAIVKPDVKLNPNSFVKPVSSSASAKTK